MSYCEKCPARGTCLRWPIFCAWMAAPEPDPSQVAHVRARSVRPDPGPAERAAGLPVAVAMRRARDANRCEWRSTEGCGCAGARCALRGGAIVSHLDCFDCVGRYG